MIKHEVKAKIINPDNPLYPKMFGVDIEEIKLSANEWKKAVDKDKEAWDEAAKRYIENHTYRNL
jgi:hypothetical protein